MAKADRFRVVVAGLTGIAAGFAHLHRMAEDDAITQIREYVTTLPVGVRRRALDDAVRHYGRADPTDASTWWHPAAYEVLVRAGGRPGPAGPLP